MSLSLFILFGERKKKAFLLYFPFVFVWSHLANSGGKETPTLPFFVFLNISHYSDNNCRFLSRTIVIYRNKERNNSVSPLKYEQERWTQKYSQCTSSTNESTMSEFLSPGFSTLQVSSFPWSDTCGTKFSTDTLEWYAEAWNEKLRRLKFLSFNVCDVVAAYRSRKKNAPDHNLSFRH